MAFAPEVRYNHSYDEDKGQSDSMFDDLPGCDYTKVELDFVGSGKVPAQEKFAYSKG